MSFSRTLHLFGYGLGLGAATSGTQDGPIVMQQSQYLSELLENGIKLHWHDIIKPTIDPDASKVELITECCKKLAQNIEQTAKDKKFFCVVGGDHSCAIGTWSGASHAFKSEGDFGLIWIDAHMDCHTHDTTPSGNIHGMPLASLLGYGMPTLAQIMNPHPKIKPENLCLIGVRSYERGEAALLKQLNVRIFFMEEVKERGLTAVLQEAIQIASKKTVKFGVSIDIDSIDPEEAPGTGCPVPNGIRLLDLYRSLQWLAKDPKLGGFEIVEFDPHLDKNKKTEKIVAHLMATMMLGNDCYAFFKDSCACAATASF